MSREPQSAVSTFAGVSIDSGALSDTVERALKSVQGGEVFGLRFVNAYSLAIASTDGEYRTVLNSPNSRNYADGRPLAVYMRRFRKKDSIHQVRGDDFFNEFLSKGRASGVRHFFLGSDEETLDKLRESVLLRHPGVDIVGSYSPPFRPQTATEQSQQDQLVTASGANFVWVALGTPKQDFEAERLRLTTGISNAAVGAAFDFTAGNRLRAPRLLQRLGLEWLFRLVSEPRRLWRRYLWGNARFVLLVISDAWTKRVS